MFTPLLNIIHDSDSDASNSPSESTLYSSHSAFAANKNNTNYENFGEYQQRDDIVKLKETLPDEIDIQIADMRCDNFDLEQLRRTLFTAKNIQSTSRKAVHSTVTEGILQDMYAFDSGGGGGGEESEGQQNGDQPMITIDDNNALGQGQRRGTAMFQSRPNLDESSSRSPGAVQISALSFGSPSRDDDDNKHGGSLATIGSTEDGDEDSKNNTHNAFSGSPSSQFLGRRVDSQTRGMVLLRHNDAVDETFEDKARAEFAKRRRREAEHHHHDDGNNGGGNEDGDNNNNNVNEHDDPAATSATAKKEPCVDLGSYSGHVQLFLRVTTHGGYQTVSRVVDLTLTDQTVATMCAAGLQVSQHPNVIYPGRCPGVVTMCFFQVPRQKDSPTAMRLKKRMEATDKKRRKREKAKELERRKREEQQQQMFGESFSSSFAQQGAGGALSSSESSSAKSSSSCTSDEGEENEDGDVLNEDDHDDDDVDADNNNSNDDHQNETCSSVGRTSTVKSVRRRRKINERRTREQQRRQLFRCLMDNEEEDDAAERFQEVGDEDNSNKQQQDGGGGGGGTGAILKAPSVAKNKKRAGDGHHTIFSTGADDRILRYDRAVERSRIMSKLHDAQRQSEELLRIEEEEEEAAAAATAAAADLKNDAFGASSGSQFFQRQRRSSMMRRRRSSVTGFSASLREGNMSTVFNSSQIGGLGAMKQRLPAGVSRHAILELELDESELFPSNEKGQIALDGFGDLPTKDTLIVSQQQQDEQQLQSGAFSPESSLQAIGGNSAPFDGGGLRRATRSRLLGGSTLLGASCASGGGLSGGGFSPDATDRTASRLTKQQQQQRDAALQQKMMAEIDSFGLRIPNASSAVVRKRFSDNTAGYGVAKQLAASDTDSDEELAAAARGDVSNFSIDLRQRVADALLDETRAEFMAAALAVDAHVIQDAVEKQQMSASLSTSLTASRSLSSPAKMGSSVRSFSGGPPDVLTPGSLSNTPQTNKTEELLVIPRSNTALPGEMMMPMVTALHQQQQQQQQRLLQQLARQHQLEEESPGFVSLSPVTNDSLANSSALHPNDLLGNSGPLTPGGGGGRSNPSNFLSVPVALRENPNSSFSHSSNLSSSNTPHSLAYNFGAANSSTPTSTTPDWKQRALLKSPNKSTFLHPDDDDDDEFLLDQSAIPGKKSGGGGQKQQQQQQQQQQLQQRRPRFNKAAARRIRKLINRLLRIKFELWCGRSLHDPDALKLGETQIGLGTILRQVNDALIQCDGDVEELLSNDITLSAPCSASLGREAGCGDDTVIMCTITVTGIKKKSRDAGSADFCFSTKAGGASSAADQNRRMSAETVSTSQQQQQQQQNQQRRAAFDLSQPQRQQQQQHDSPRQRRLQNLWVPPKKVEIADAATVEEQRRVHEKLVTDFVVKMTERTLATALAPAMAKLELCEKRLQAMMNTLSNLQPVMVPQF